MENNKYLLVIGDSSVLCEAIIKVFKNNSSNWKICLIDYSENIAADRTIILENNCIFNEDLVRGLQPEIEAFSKAFDAIINVQGSWTRGSVKSSDIFEQSNLMFNKNYYSALLGKFLLKNWL